LVDLNTQEASAGGPELALAMLAGSNQVLLMQMESKVRREEEEGGGEGGDEGGDEERGREGRVALIRP
jgi:hypothetical protein